MSFNDPLSINVTGTAASLPRVSTSGASSTYQSSDQSVKESISHSQDKRKTRRVIRVDLSKIAPDPLISSQNIKYDMSAYLVVQVPVTGFTIAEQKAVVDGLTTQLNASSGALLTKFLGGES